MRSSRRESLLLKCCLRLVAVLPLVLLATLPSLAQTSSPAKVSSLGYINGTPLTAHTSAAFNSTGASTLVAFVSRHPFWNGQPVRYQRPERQLWVTPEPVDRSHVFSGTTFSLVFAVYYVNSPISSATHTVTVQLTNPAPLVFHVFAVSGSDVTGPPIFSAITDPGAGRTSANVMTAPVTVPTNSLLLSWVKNETAATATALNRFTLDTKSTSFLWAESQSPISAGSYTGDFQYDSAIAAHGHRRPPPSLGPVALSQAVTTSQNTPVGITLTVIVARRFRSLIPF